MARSGASFPVKYFLFFLGNRKEGAFSLFEESPFFFLFLKPFLFFRRRGLL